MKKQISMIMAAIMLSSCALQDKGFVGPSEENDKVLSVENAETGEVSKLFEGYEELQGKQIGEHIIMPEVITPLEVSDVFTFETENYINEETVEEDGKAFFKRFFGDDYDESLTHYEDTTYKGTRYIREWYNFYDESLNIGKEDPDNKDRGMYEGYPASVSRDGAYTYAAVPSFTMLAEYDPKKDRDVVIELDDGSFTVGDICDAAMSFFVRELQIDDELSPIVYRLWYFLDETDPGRPHRRAQAVMTYEKNGIPIMSWSSAYYTEEKSTPNGKETTYFAASTYFIVLSGPERIVVAMTGMAQKQISEKKVDNIISLGSAARLLDENLAEKLRFKIEDVQLKYCRKITGFEPNDEAVKAGAVPSDHFHEYRPLWVFEFAGGRGHFIVDAITGEITIDAQVDVLNELRSEQLK